MVYFGSRNYQKARPGLSPGDKIRFVIPFVLFGGVISLLVTIAVQQSGSTSVKFVEPSEELVSHVAGAMRDFLAFHKATELVVEESTPSDFGRKLMAAI